MALNQNATELERLRISCCVELAEAIPKAQEILRRMDVKCRPGSLGKGELCRTMIAFDLACRALAYPIPHKTVLRLAGAPAPVYDSALGLAQRFLGEQRRYTCQEIAKAVGGARVGIMASAELKRYKERFLATYPARQAASIDLEGTVYAVAAFYLCAKKLKHPVDKGRLLELSLVREAEFTMVCRSMLDLCYSTLGVSVSDKPSAERLQQLEKAAAVASRKREDTEGKRQPSSSSADQNGGSASSSAVSSARNGCLTSRGGAERRTIPLTRPVVGEDPRNHATALARSIRTAAGRRWHGGAVVKQMEPGGGNEASDAVHDQKHPPKKRPHPSTSRAPTASIPVKPQSAAGKSTTGGRRSGPPQGGTRVATPSSAPHPPGANAEEGFHPSSGVPAVAAAGATTTLASTPRGDRKPVQNPYASAVRKPVEASLVGSKRCESRSEAGGKADGGLSSSAVTTKAKSNATDFGLTDSSSSNSPRCDDSKDPSCDRGGDGASDALLPHDGDSGFAGGGSTGRRGGGVVSAEGMATAGVNGTRKEREEWKERALVAMENRMKKSRGSDGVCETVQGDETDSVHPFNDVGGSSSGIASGGVSASGSKKQASLKTFFSPASKG